MQFQDHRITGDWLVGNVIVDTNDQRYLVIQHQADDVLVGQFSLLSITNSYTVLTAPNLTSLRTTFGSAMGNTVREVIPAEDIVLDVINQFG
jgi:hypothetical protein